MSFCANRFVGNHLKGSHAGSGKHHESGPLDDLADSKRLRQVSAAAECAVIRREHFQALLDTRPKLAHVLLNPQGMRAVRLNGHLMGADLVAGTVIGHSLNNRGPSIDTDNATVFAHGFSRETW